MINPKEFYNNLIKNKIDFFTGVPDSLLKHFCSYILEKAGKNNIITANEGNAIALASGYHITTGKYALVYMQNSGIGNAINPLLSLSDEDVYKIPMLLLIGYRGEPEIHDEPQHKKQGKLTLKLLETLGIDYQILSSNYKEQIEYCYNYMKEHNKPIALIVKKNTFDNYKKIDLENNYTLTREEALDTIIKELSEQDFYL